MNTSSLYRLEVAPLVILPFSRSPFFSYTSTTPIKKGSLVSISFGKQTIEGVVFACRALPGAKPQWMKSVTRVIREEFLTEQQCALAQLVSEECFTPLGKTLKHFLPKIVQARKKITGKEEVKDALPRSTKEEQQLLKKFLAAKQPTFLDTSLSVDPKRPLLLIAKEMLRKNKQLLVLVPEITLIPSLAERFKKHFGNETVITLQSKLSGGVFFSAWERIRSGEAGVIIATRQGLFAPFHDLGAIIVTEEQDDSYKQWDMSPRYHGKRVAAALSEISGAKLVLTSGTPSAESILSIQEKRLTPLLPIPAHKPLGPGLTVVNLKLERYRKNFSPLSEALVSELREILAQKKQALLYINRQGMNAFSVCEQCKNVFRCKNCDHPLSSTREGHFHCPSCGYNTPIFPSCPSCGNITFRHVGFGTEKVEREVSKPFPGARIARLDSTALKTAKTPEKIYEKGMAREIDVLIGTQMVLKDPPLPKLALIGIIDADSLLLFPDFQADERLYQSLSRAVRQVTEKGKKGYQSGKVLIQTFRPESAFFQKAATLGSEDFFKQTLNEREDLFYPPFSRLISLACQGKTEKEVTKKITTLSVKLRELIPKNYRLHEPSPVRFLKKQALFQSTLLLRFPHKELLAEAVRKLLKENSKDVIVDVDPLSIN